MLDRWDVALDDRKYVIAIFLDLSKAFDTMDHELLLLKLTRYGFFSLSIHLIRSYLSNRFSISTFDGAKSKPEALKVGVPQGSVLGPLLFISFISFSSQYILFLFYSNLILIYFFKLLFLLVYLTYVSGDRTLCIIKLNLL